jgi:acetyl esterase/lipase
MPEPMMPRLVSYKQSATNPLMLHVFDPPPGAPVAPEKGRPTIVFFFGGGWTHGTPVQFYPECRHFSSAGWVAISADYRIAATHGSSPFDAVADAKSALRHLRSHAREFGVDPTRIVAAGASAGGHLAAATACLPGLDDPADDLRTSPRPDALVLWYPVIDNGPGGYGHDRIGKRFREFSPLHNLRPGFPPTLVFLGTQDRHVPVATMERFAAEIRKSGGRCEVRLFPGAGHPIYSFRDSPLPPVRAECLAEADAFLASALPIRHLRK